MCEVKIIVLTKKISKKIGFCIFRIFQYNTVVRVLIAFVAQSVERSLGKTEVSGSIPDKGSAIFSKLIA